MLRSENRKRLILNENLLTDGFRLLTNINEHTVRVHTDDKGSHGAYFNCLNSAVSILPRLMEFLQQIQQRYTHPLFWCGFYTVVIAFIAFGIQQPVIPKPVWIYIAGSAFVHLLYKLSLTHAYTVGEISFIYPITRAAPAFLPLFAFLFLNERISGQGLIGILCVMASILVYQQREARIQFKAFFRFLRQPDALWAYATLASVIGYSLIDKQGMS